MTTILDQESELGHCEPDIEADLGDVPEWDLANALLFVHTRADLNSHGSMLKIEQHCFIRVGTQVLEQPWVQSRILLEPTGGSNKEAEQLAAQAHQQFIAEVKNLVPTLVLN
ncbi:MAG: hypothetical protein SFY81_10825 [Verrucomicrobiota bacterium]|nr:hypothetical protein [Verrucomicrobiota bacterium]